MKEIWKEIDVLGSKYEASNLGKIRNSKSKKELHQYTNEFGYKMVRIQIINNRKHYRVHRLVACTFILNPNNYPQINHKDENKTNNSVDNLEWCTAKYNSNYGNHNKKLSTSHKGKPNKYKSKKIIQYDLNMNFIKEFNSIKEAVKETKVSRSSIYRSCKKVTKKERKYIFRYKKGEI